MADNSSKRAYKKINTTFSNLNEKDEFAQSFTKLLKSATTTFYQKERRERRIFDDSWLESVENSIPTIDKLTRNPRENLKKVRHVVPVEQAKKTDRETIRHLAENTQFIKTIKANGDVIPSQVLTSYMDSDFGTYENRFIMSLVDKLYIFIEKRYDLIVTKMHTEYVNYLNLKSNVVWNEATIDYDITMKINQTLPQDDVDKHNQELFDRMTKVRSNMTQFKNSTFMKMMSQFTPVTPPIMKTNVIMKNVDFRQCYALWVLMDQIDRIGYDVDVLEKDIVLSDKYREQINNSLMMFYATLANQQADEYSIDESVPVKYKRLKAPRIVTKNAQDQTIQPGTYELENNKLNQYYLDQIRDSNVSRFNTLTDAQIPFEESINIVFKQVTEISNAVYEDYISSTFKPEEESNLSSKINTQEQILEVYKQIEKIKREDISQLKTARAVALLSLRNYKDELKAVELAASIERDRLAREEQLRKDEIEKQRRKEELAQKRAIERAEKLLKNAQKNRLQRAYEKAKKELESFVD